MEEKKREEETLYLGMDEIPDDLGEYGKKLA